MSDTWLITGASGLLGRAACRLLAADGARVVAVRHEHDVAIEGVEEVRVDLTDLAGVRRLIEDVSPRTVLHTAGLTDVDRCEQEPDLAERIHVDVTAAVAVATSAVGGRLVHISTDHLWDGTRPYVDEATPPRPMNVYGATKLAGEHAALAADPSALVVRTNFFGEGSAWRRSLSDWIIGELRGGRRVRAFRDVFFTPIHLQLLVATLRELVDLGVGGVVHVAGSERVSKLEFAQRLGARLGFDADAIISASVDEADLAAPRPRDMSLSTELAASMLGRSLPDLDASFAALADEVCRERS